MTRRRVSSGPENASKRPCVSDLREWEALDSGNESSDGEAPEAVHGSPPREPESESAQTPIVPRLSVPSNVYEAGSVLEPANLVNMYVTLNIPMPELAFSLNNITEVNSNIDLSETLDFQLEEPEPVEDASTITYTTYSESRRTAFRVVQFRPDGTGGHNESSDEVPSDGYDMTSESDTSHVSENDVRFWGVEYRVRGYGDDCDTSEGYDSEASDASSIWQIGISELDPKPEVPEKPMVNRVLARPSQGRSVKCSFCRQQFHCRSYLREHLRMHYRRKRYLCLKCLKTYDGWRSLKQHARIHDTKNPSDNGAIFGDEEMENGLSDDEFFRTESQRMLLILSDPVMKAHELGLSRNDICFSTENSSRWPGSLPQLLPDFGDLIADVILSRTRGPMLFTCRHCPLQGRSQSEMEAHAQVHHRDAPLACDLCSAKFFLEFERERHRFVHARDCAMDLRQSKTPTCNCR